MKQLLLHVLSLVACLCLQVKHLHAQSKPNIVVILVDDAGHKDWGFQGSEIAITPNIDALASEGTIFSQGYVTNSVCAPSRAGLLTGQYQNKHGFEYNIVSYSTSPDHTLADVGLDPSVPTMGDYLKDLGYTTSLFGKWHVGEEEHHRPNARGFDHFYGLLSGSRNYNQVETAFNKKLRRNGIVAEPADNNFYLTDLLTDEALSFMTTEIDGGRPFLAFMSYTAPHGPFQAKPEDKALFNAVAGLSSDQKNYYGMIKNVDDNVERMVDLLKAKNQYDNTLFVFLSDNGGVSLTDNGVLRGNKSSQYEGGLRVPFFATWKGNIPSNTVYNQQIISLDLTTTFIKAAGGDLAEATYAELDGADLVTASNNVNTPLHNMLYWRKLDRWGIASDGVNKLLFEATDPASNLYDTVLYNLDNDISEVTNVYATNAGSVTNLVASYNAWNTTLDLPSWYGDGILDKVCPSANNAKNCQVLVDRFEAFGVATRLKEVNRKSVSVEEFKKVAIQRSALEFTDPIKSANVVTYEVTSLPQKGNLVRHGTALQVGDKFTQRAINDGALYYESTTGAGEDDTITFTVKDGSGNEALTNVTFTVATTVQRSQGTDYYFSSSEGDDSNSGTSENSPFASIDKLNELVLQPGDWVHFKRGDTFIGQINCNYSGVDGAPIVYKDYGSGALPILSGSTGNDGVPDPLTTFLIIDQSYLEFSNLHIRNERFDAMDGVDNDKAFGILCYTEQLGPHKVGVNGALPTGYSNKQYEEAILNTDTLAYNEHLYFSDLYFDKVYSLGLDGIPFNSVRSTAIYLEEALARDVIIEDSYFTDLQRTGIWLRRWSSDVIIRNNQFVDIGGSGAILSVSNRILYESNYMQFCGANSDGRMAKRGSGMWTFGCNGVVAQHNVSKHARGDGDSSGMHVDYGNSNILYQYNYSEDAAGGFCETLGDNDNIIWRYNISVNDADTDRGGKNLLLWISRYSSNNAKSRDVHIYNNTIYAGTDYDNEITDAKVLFEVQEFNFINNILYLKSGSKLGVGSGKYTNSANSPNFKKNIFFGGEFNSNLKALDATRIEQDPLFIGGGTHNERGYVLQEGSPAIGAAESFEEPTFPYAGQGVFADVTAKATKDYYGNAVNLASTTNIGAYNGVPSTLALNETTYEAETATINGGSIINCSNASGQSSVDASSSSVSFIVNVEETKEYILKVYYLNPSVSQVGVTVNNEEEEMIFFQKNNGFCYQDGVPTNYQIVKTLNAGYNTITVSNTIVDKLGVVTFEESDITPPNPPQNGPIYEAEEAILTGTAVITSCGNASGGEMVKNLTGGSSNAVLFKNISSDQSSTYNMIVSYYAVSDASISYQVNNGTVQTATLPASGSWCYQGGSPADYTLTVTLESGNNDIIFFDSPIIDKIEIAEIPFEGTWEAEEASLSGTAVINNCATSSGGQSVKGLSGGSSNAVTFGAIDLPVAGEFDLKISYMSATATTITIEVNGVPQTYNLTATGQWCYQGGSPGDYTVLVDLVQGMNTIKVYDGPQLDKIEISNVQTTSSVRSVIDEIATDNEVVIYPNPVQKGNVLHINPTADNLQQSLYVYDAYGRLMYQDITSGSDSIQIPTHSFTPGIYFIKIENSKSKLVKKIIVK
ncbi:sulfatase-like hydrolase/transferase [Flammeovirga aprica]|uniref:Sulfatase-like hydrolase/transferase n=1 Tax=Flammeovirga aprica JL-4 TaxID=694437 RepID=A0A7X9RXD2_9BACT|nr:sulfatase-like hydrolase/transferase [Flammeovirga aprica]NME70433.1 sulfatase-like hydrolase/transferase [Flammeovirga aprica JL-4]